MSRWYGKVGYATTTEQTPGIWVDGITERYYSGDLILRKSRWESAEGRNDDLYITNEISILADAYAIANFSQIKYVECMNQNWKVISVEIQHPRLILTVGGIWNGESG